VDTVKDRVYAAAEAISAERNPTVSSVRETAGVSNADATRYLRQWRQERESTGTQIAATPQPIAEQATRLAGALWAEASRLAADKHAAVEAAWAQEKQNKDVELAELVADLDRLNAEKDRALAEVAAGKDRTIADLTARLENATARTRAAGEETARAHEAAEAARTETAGLKADLAAAQARAATLQQTHDALLERIHPRQQNPDDAQQS
jgi:chromosome segregation ATPase